MTAPAEVTIPHNLSYSQKSTLSDCGGRYYLERAQKVPQRPGWANVGGTAGHSTTEELDRRLYEAGEHIGDLDTIRDIFGSYFKQEVEKTERYSGFDRTEFRPSGRASKQWPNKEDAAWWASEGPLMVLSWVRWRDASPFQIAEVGTEVSCEGCGGGGITGALEPSPCADCGGMGVSPALDKSLAIELWCEFKAGGATIKAAVDRLMVRETSDGPEYMVLDLKFGSREPAGPDQLLTYRLGISECYGVDPKWGTYWMARKAMSTTPADLHRFSLEQVHYDYRMAQEQRLRGDFRYHPTNICVACSVNAYCPVFGGEYANTIPQPWELTAPPTLREPADRV